ncbi:MAG: hypothetical protein MUE85_14070 [Microscillaceae bacterium]|jgi:hypothetical protein|nr:hypothetical protein [Microscillaceae bacterium]
MRILIRIFLGIVPIAGALLMSDCAPVQPNYHNYLGGKIIHDIPLEKKTTQMEVYQAGQYPPNPDFIRLRTLEVSSLDGYSSLMTDLENLARQSGFDGLIEVQKSDTEIAQTQMIDDKPYTTLKRKFQISAVGIKYLKNIDYIHKYPKIQKLYAHLNFIKNPPVKFKIDSSAWASYVQQYETLKQIPFTSTDSLLAEAHFTAGGHLQKVIDYGQDSLNYYQMFVYPYSLTHLLYETKNWHYLNDANGKVKIRKKLDDFGRVLETIRLKYFFETPYIKSAQVFAHNNGNQANLFKYQIDLKYDAQGKWIEKIVYKIKNAVKHVHTSQMQYNTGAFLKEIPAYDQQNRLTHSTIFLWENEKWRPILYTYNEFYTYDDLRLLLSINRP